MFTNAWGELAARGMMMSAWQIDNELLNMILLSAGWLRYYRMLLVQFQ